ncbi:hypothetical protein [Bacillus sp. ISL-46]|uniref:hypothetical protein n=1 Tax=Bacillus sp. ISL-46 TaxID=2819129 RepID=UPI001BECC6E4|nr:hypothetical protein [Bacillus sp. ISL-46]MBT2725319.1 hypothetical protein [Bacillus sp. ISL-46]
MDLTKEDIAGYDAIIDGVIAWVPETFYVHTDGVSHIANLLDSSNTRYIKIGGTGTLFINKENTKTIDFVLLEGCMLVIIQG